MTEEIRTDSATITTSKYRKKKSLEKCQISVEVRANLLRSFPNFSQKKEVKGLKQEIQGRLIKSEFPPTHKEPREVAVIIRFGAGLPILRSSNSQE